MLLVPVHRIVFSQRAVGGVRVPKEIRREEVDEATLAVRQAARILRPVPVVQRELGVDLADEPLEAVDQFAVPGDEGGAVMHVCVGVDLVLLEPVADSPSNKLVALTKIVILRLQLDDRVAQPIALFLADCRNVSTNAISKDHD